MLFRHQASTAISVVASLSINMFSYVIIFFIILFSTSIAWAQDINGNAIRILDAVAITLEKQPNILLGQQDVEISRGALRQQSGVFDTSIQANMTHDHNDIPITELEEQAGGYASLTDSTTAGLSIVKEFRTGVTVTPSIQVVRTALTPSVIETENAANISFTISIPLLKGLGVNATGANEMAAKRDLETTILALRYSMSQNVLTTVSAYWNYLAALKILDQRRESRIRAEQNYNDTKKLIEGDERAGADIELVSANLAAKAAACITAEQALFSAKHALGLAMGIPYAKIESLPVPADDFPPVRSQEISRIGAELRVFLDQSLLRRADYLASKEAQESAKILVEQAKNYLLPQLDFQVGVGYSGLDEGSRFSNFTSSLWNKVPGASTSASLTYKWPFMNNSARGNLQQKLAIYNKAVINSDELARSISSSVSQDISNLINSALGLNKYNEAVKHYTKAVDNERKKFFLGMSTMTQVLTTEDNLIAASINWILSESTYAIALAQLRFETGTLLADSNELGHIGMDELTTIPFIAEHKGK